MSILLQKQKAVSINFKELMPELSRRNRATHHIHRYPAKLIPHIPNYLINKFTEAEDIILDPFCGSGTTLLEALLCNRNALGVEINPVGRLISKVKTTPIDINELKNTAKNCYKKIKNCENFTIPEFKNRDMWFNANTQKDLAKIKASIADLDIDKNQKDFLNVCFSAIIYKVSNCEQRDIMPRLSKNPNPPNALTEFLRHLDYCIERMADLQSLQTKSEIIGGDAKKIHSSRKVNMVITSPPYLSAMTYFRTTKLEHYWLSNGNVDSYRNQARQTINGELLSGINKKMQFVDISEIDDFISLINDKSPHFGFKASMYFADMMRILKNLHTIILNDGQLAIIVGNSQILDTRVPLNYFFQLMGAKIGFNFITEMVDEIKFHKLATKRSKHSNRIYNEHILLFKK